MCVCVCVCVRLRVCVCVFVRACACRPTSGPGAGRWRARPPHTLHCPTPTPQVLADNGHVAVVNCNPSFQPLMREAALHCTNPNMLWHWSPWQPGTLAKGLPLNRSQPIRCARLGGYGV